MKIELFPCSGGMAKGFQRAGITFDLAIDHDENACASYEKNLGHRPLRMDVNDFARLVRAGWRPAHRIDLLVADPPCTPWSRAGKREGLDDERDCLAVTAELIALLQPRAYLIGNVPGLQDSTSWHVVQDVIGGLRQHGYCVTDYVALDAADYGVPQHRVRPFWFGHLEGPCIRWPAPTHGPPSSQLAIGDHALLAWVTCRQALGHLPLEQLGRPVRMRIRPKGADGTKHGGDITRCSAPDEPGKTVMVKDSRKGGQILIPVGTAMEHPRHPISRPDGAPDRPSDVVTSHPARVGAGPGQVLEWPWDRPATTIFGDERLSVPGHHDAKIGNSSHAGPNAVVLSEKAAAILQGFPKDWLFAGETKQARWAQIGMAMPPGLAEPVARAVADQMAVTSWKAVG